VITIKGASDDVIVIGGDMSEEIDVYENGHLTLSDGTVLAHSYTHVWRFEVERAGSATIEIERCSGDEDADVYTDKVAVSSPIEWVKKGVHEVPGPGDIPHHEKAATVDREAASAMTIREVHDRCLDALEGGQETAGASAELDYTHDLLNALDEELKELRDERDRLNGLANRVPETQEQRPTATAMLAAWLDDQEAELAKLREFARQVAPVILEEFQQEIHPEEGLLPIATATLDMEVLEKLTGLAEDLDLGWEARA
jgi:hypothetical protein